MKKGIWFIYQNWYIYTMNKELKHVFSELTEQTGLLDFYCEQAEKLERKEIDFSICDLDDTLFSRAEQLENEPMLKAKRGYEWNTYMINEIGINSMIEKYYVGKNYPQDILKQCDIANTLILTAGIPEYQMRKYESLNLAPYAIEIVREGKDKVLATIRYILFSLKYIPTSITVYEDRPQFFIKYRTLIEWCLNTKLKIFFVEMDGNRWYKKIEAV